MRRVEEYQDARRELDRRGLSLYRGSTFTRLVQRVGFRAPKIGELTKSWDVLLTLQFLEQYLKPAEPVVDFGANGSEILGALHRLGFRNLHGVDLEPDVVRGPYAGSIRYYVQDFMHTSYADSSFAAITAISAVEHGLDVSRLLSEVFRLLRPGGYFIGSTDYWPKKIDTDGIKLYGLDWIIFDEEEMRGFVAEARRIGLELVGDADYVAEYPLVNVFGKWYTFAWFALRKI